MKKLLILSLLLLCVALPCWAGSYVFRQRANWVKLEKLSHKQLAGQTLSHPYTSLRTQDMEAMLLSLSMNKASAFSKKIDTTEIFNSFEARRFAPYIVQALNQADPNQVVNVSIIHKRPAFVMRNDYVSNLNIYLTQEGIHFYFNKLFARLVGDYSEASNLDDALRKAKSLRVNLEPQPGQKLSYNNPLHLIFEIGHDFTQDTAIQQAAVQTQNEEALKPKSRRGKIQAPAVQPAQESFPSQPVPTAAPVSDIAERLQKLDALKRLKLITAQEYQQKRKEILNSL